MTKSNKNRRDRSRSREKEDNSTQQEPDKIVASQASADLIMLQSQQSDNSQSSEFLFPALTQPETLQPEMKTTRRKRSKSPTPKVSAETIHKQAMIEIENMPKAGIPKIKKKKQIDHKNPSIGKLITSPTLGTTSQINTNAADIQVTPDQSSSNLGAVIDGESSSKETERIKRLTSNPIKKSQRIIEEGEIVDTPDADEISLPNDPELADDTVKHRPQSKKKGNDDDISYVYDSSDHGSHKLYHEDTQPSTIDALTTDWKYVEDKNDLTDWETKQMKWIAHIIMHHPDYKERRREAYTYARINDHCHYQLRTSAAKLAGIDLSRHSPFTALGDNRFPKINNVMRALRRSVYDNQKGPCPDNFDFESLYADNYYDYVSEQCDSTIATNVQPELTDEQKELQAETQRQIDEEFRNKQMAIRADIEKKTELRKLEATEAQLLYDASIQRKNIRAQKLLTDQISLNDKLKQEKQDYSRRNAYMRKRQRMNWSRSYLTPCSN